MKKSILLLAIFCWTTSMSAYAAVTAELFLNGKKQYSAPANLPLIIELEIMDKDSGRILREFDSLHGKIMHMMLVKKDLSTFAHVHPYLEPESGRFLLAINLPHHDPDNFAAERAFVEPGMYMLMAEVVIKNVGLRKFAFEIEASGIDSTQVPLTIDPLDATHSITKYFNRNGEWGNYGELYEAKFRLHTAPGCGGNLIRVTLALNEWDPQVGYVPLEKLQPWLRMGAHAAWFSQKMMSPQGGMAMGHLHARMPQGDSPLIFTYFDAGQLNSGLQKIWFQVKINDKVLGLPFVFDYEVPDTADSCN